MNISNNEKNRFNFLITVLSEYNKEHNKFFSELEIYSIANVIMTASKNRGFPAEKKDMFTNLYVFKDCKFRKDEFYTVVYDFFDKLNPQAIVTGPSDGILNGDFNQAEADADMRHEYGNDSTFDLAPEGLDLMPKGDDDEVNWDDDNY